MIRITVGFKFQRFLLFGDGYIDLRVYTPKKLLNLNDNFYWPLVKNEIMFLIEGYISC